MSIKLSVAAQNLISQIGIEPQIILDIEGLDLIFGARPVFREFFWDDDNPEVLWDNGLRWDDKIVSEKSRDWISLNETTTNITQQIQPDKGSISSISTVNVSIVDKGGEVSRATSFDKIGDILGRKAVFSIGFSDGIYPDDANPVFRGVVVDFYESAGSVMISIASPESLKKQVFLEKFQTELSSPINSSAVNIPLLLTQGIYIPGNALTCYLRVNDELMQIISVDSPTQATVVRGQLATVAGNHGQGDTVETFYRLQGNPIDLSLKMMLSKTGNANFQSLDVPRSVGFVNITDSIDNALIFDYYDIREKTGLTNGDYVQITGPNAGEYQVIEMGILDQGGSYIVLDGTLTEEEEFTGAFSYRSKYNVLTTGLGMLTSQVDVEQFERIKAQFGNNFVDYDIYVKDSIDNAKEFIDTEIFFPQGLYSIPRKARSSVKFIAPPFSSDIVPYLGTSSVTNASRIRQRRSIHKYLYNTFVWRYNVDSIEDKYLSGKIVISSNSLNRIDIGKKQMLIESHGLRNNPSTTIMIESITARLVDRYQFAPVYYDGIEVSYKDGYTLEVGDIVPFGGKDLQSVDLQTGERGRPFLLYEVYNKTLNVKNGKISLDLVQTAFDIFARYGVISLASTIGDGSTTERIRITKSLDTGEYPRESDKWLKFVGQTVRVRSPDYSFDEESILLGVDPFNKDFLVLETAISISPLIGYVIEPAVYQGDTEFNDRFKIEFVHWVPRVKITSVVSSLVFSVDDASKLLIGSRVVVSSDDFSRDSFGAIHIIDAIAGNQVTLKTALEFTPVIGDNVNSTRFQDGGDPYLLI